MFPSLLRRAPPLIATHVTKGELRSAREALAEETNRTVKRLLLVLVVAARWQNVSIGGLGGLVLVVLVVLLIAGKL